MPLFSNRSQNSGFKMNRIRTSRSHSFFFFFVPMKSVTENMAVASFLGEIVVPIVPMRRRARKFANSWTWISLANPLETHGGVIRSGTGAQEMASDGPFTEPSSLSLSLSLSPENERKKRATVEKEGLKTRSNRQLLHDEWMGNGRSMDRLGNCVFLPAILLETSLEFLLPYTRLFIKCVLPSSARVFSLELRGKIVD